MEFIDLPSPHFNERPEGVVPSLVVIHFTGGKSFEYAVETLTKGRGDHKAGAHYLIHEDGRIFRMIGEDKRAWHAGVGFWNDLGDINNISIGIELSNRDRKPYPEAQLVALTRLVKDIQKRYGIPPENIIGHSDLAPERKDDPGYHFPWNRMAEEGIGVMPEVRLRDHFRARATAKKPAKLQKLFSAAGYGDYDLTKLVAAFQQHYQPGVYLHPGKNEAPGQPTAEMVAKLKAAARFNKKHHP